MLVAFTGNIGAGKDTAAQILIDKYGYKKISFADRLKDILSILFSWDRDMLEGRTLESRQWREEKDEWWSAKLGRDITPRQMLREFGTDIFRDKFNADVWVLCVERMLGRAAGAGTDSVKYVITDCRFENEAAMITRLGGRIVEICRNDTGRGQGQGQGHISDAGIPQAYVHEKIDNNGTVSELEAEIGFFMSRWV
jgi:hypothetical protein